MAKTLQLVNMIWGFISIFFLKFWTYVGKGQKQSNGHGNILEWQREEVTKLQKVLKAKQVLNKKQCINLLNKLDQVVFYVNEIIISTKETSNKFGLALEELCRITRKVRVLVQDCGKQEWCHAAAFQMNNTEAFRELVYDLKCFWDAIGERYLAIYPDSQNYRFPCIDFNVATYDEIQSDEEALEGRLKKRLQTMPNDFEDYELAKHLLRRLQYDLRGVKGAKFPKDVIKPVFLKQIGSGAAGEVYKSSWLGLQSATKMLKCGHLNFRKEAGIQTLSHPNLIKFICCGIFNESMAVSRNLFLVMELMEMSLSDLLKKQKTPLPYLVAIDIMHEIARGMCYLHDMYVAHLNLKPNNVLLSSVRIAEVEGNFGYDFVKLTDYDTSKMEAQSKPELQKCTIGTPNYMAPEMNDNTKNPHLNVACPFQADVWSFAMTCSETLSLKEPFADTKNTKVILQKIKDCFRPKLPINCKELTMLIEECWVVDPSQRPTFANICKRLATLKKKFMVGTYSNDIPLFDKDETTSRNIQLKASNYMNISPPKKVDERRTQYEVLVGLESNLAKVRNHLKRVNILGLIGIGGIGKTTLAKAIFNDVRSTYNASCFIENLKSKSSLEILREILQNFGRDIEDSWKLVDAQKIIKELLAAKKVLLILDDPKDAAQVHDIIATDVPCVNNGTKIIITTRVWGVIEHRVHLNGKIDVGKLNGNAAKELFNSYVFLDGAHLSPQLFDLRDKVVETCKGLPLSLKVMGAFLRGKERIRSWERAFQRMKRGRCLDGDEGLWSTLRISFDGLENDEKNMFLDIACFWKERALHICTNYGTSPIHVLDILVDKALVKIDQEGFLEMHDQLRDMGQMIVETDKEYLGTRIWKKNMIPLANGSTHDKNYKKVEAICLNEGILQCLFDNCMAIEDLDVSSLRLLICWRLTTLPEGLWNLTSLTKLYLLGCSSLTTLSEGLGNLTSLRTFDLSECRRLTTIPEGLGNLSSLATFDLSGCSSLTTLPEGLGNLSSLATFDLSGCSSLTTLPEGLGNLTSLTTFDLFGCSSLTTLPEELGNLTSLTTLRLSDCSNLIRIPEGLGNLTSLTTLCLLDCSSLTRIPEGLGNLTSLTTFDLFGCSSLTTLPEELNLSSLTTLCLSGCSSLTRISDALGNLTSLKTFDLSRCSSLTRIPEGLGDLISLTTLDLSKCWSLTKLPEGLGNLTSLTTLNLFRCLSLTTLPEGLGNLISLTTFDLSRCSSLTILSEEMWNLTSLTTLDLSTCWRFTKLPEGLGNLTSLTTLNLSKCWSLTKLPEGLGNLTSSTTFDLSQCQRLTTLPERLGNLTSLTTLDLSECSSLITLPEGLGNLTSLTTLNLSRCSSLTTLPEGLGNLTSLTALNLSKCWRLTKLPEGLGNLTSLKTLDLASCSSLTTLPEGMGDLISLTTLDLSKCWRLTKFPEGLGNLTSLIPIVNGLTQDKVDERRRQYEVESNLAKGRDHLKRVNILGLIVMGGITCRATLFSTLTSSMVEIIFFCLLNLIPYWIHRRHHKDLCIDKCGGYLFCERVRLWMSMIYVQVCSLAVWSLECLYHQLPNSHIWSIISLSFLWFFWVLFGLNKIEWKYRLWSMLKFVLQGKAYVLADYIREVIPDLAPCNPFANVVNSQDVDKFITPRGQGLENLWLSMHCEEQVWKEDIHKHIERYGHLKRRVLYPIETNQRRIFLIGSGWVEVDVLEDDNFRFKSSARDRTMQYFYATLSSEQFSTLLALLAMWEDSPNLGVLENFVGRSDGIYCHCMDLQSMVEALFECTNFTVVTVLQKPIKFHIGAKCTREHSPTYLIASLAQILTVVGTYFQLKDNYNNVAIVLTSLGILAVMGAITSPSILLLEKVLVYNVLWCFRLGSHRLLRLYLQLKIWNCFLAFCDDFKPVLHRANVEPELITLFNCTHGSLTGDFDRPDWSEVEADQTPYVANAIAETNVLTSKSGKILEYRQGLDYRTFDLKCQRTVHAESKYDGDVLETQLKLDGEDFEEYRWSEDSYFLFVYLIIKWSRREFGVIRSSRHLINRRYYHVFNVHELARHIAKHKLTKYKKLLDDSVDVMTRRTLPKENVKLDPANKGEMVAGYHV